MTRDNSPALEISNLTKSFAGKQIVHGIDLKVQQGEFFSLLGPSGCGKTTTLRMLAGFEVLDKGTVSIGGEDVTHLPPQKRPVNMVFQKYELFPHLSVRDNIAFGLRLRRVAAKEIKSRVDAAMDLVHVTELADRKAELLSGGQQQRVALARAVVNRPAVLLLDEPLSALDAKLRRHMQIELKQLQEELGITFIYVTHDQEEALLMSDRIGVMNEGRFEQIGTPREIYDRPATPFVAEFIGESSFLELEVTVGHDGQPRHLTDECSIQLPPPAASESVVRALLRPERVDIHPVGTHSAENAAQSSWIKGTVATVIFAGPSINYTVSTGVGTVKVHSSSVAGNLELPVGTEVALSWHQEDLVML